MNTESTDSYEKITGDQIYIASNDAQERIKILFNGEKEVEEYKNENNSEERVRRFQIYSFSKSSYPFDSFNSDGELPIINFNYLDDKELGNIEWISSRENPYNENFEYMTRDGINEENKLDRSGQDHPYEFEYQKHTYTVEFNKDLRDLDIPEKELNAYDKAFLNNKHRVFYMDYLGEGQNILIKYGVRNARGDVIKLIDIGQECQETYKAILESVKSVGLNFD